MYKKEPVPQCVAYRSICTRGYLREDNTMRQINHYSASKSFHITGYCFILRISSSNLRATGARFAQLMI